MISALTDIKHLFLITGTTRGIGRALAAAALNRPNSFVVALSRAAASLESNHQNIQIDLNDTDHIRTALESIHFDTSRSGFLKNTILINNAGVLDPIAPIGDCDPEQLARNIQVNLTVPLVLSHHFYNYSREFAGNKWIVNISSGAARVPYYGWSAYGASKAGLEMATGAMALEFSRRDPSFKACAIAPGTVDTAMQAKIRHCTRDQFEQVDKFHELRSSGGLAAPDQVASTLLRLLMEGRFANGGRYDLRDLEKTDK